MRLGRVPCTPDRKGARRRSDWLRRAVLLAGGLFLFSASATGAALAHRQPAHRVAAVHPTSQSTAAWPGLAAPEAVPGIPTDLPVAGPPSAPPPVTAPVTGRTDLCTVATSSFNPSQAGGGNRPTSAVLLADDVTGLLPPLPLPGLSPSPPAPSGSSSGSQDPSSGGILPTPLPLPLPVPTPGSGSGGGAATGGTPPDGGQATPPSNPAPLPVPLPLALPALPSLGAPNPAPPPPPPPTSSDINCPALGGGTVGKVAPGESTAQALAVADAITMLGIPYLYAGESPQGGFDCSGLVQYIFRAAGISLPRVAQDQFDAGPAVAPGNPVEPGDLVFFGPSPTQVGHVGIYVGDGVMIDAPHTGAVVRFDRIDGFGQVAGITAPGS